MPRTIVQFFFKQNEQRKNNKYLFTKGRGGGEVGREREKNSWKVVAYYVITKFKFCEWAVHESKPDFQRRLNVDFFTHANLKPRL